MNPSSGPLILSRAEQSDLRRINLNNYYKNESSWLMTNCQICKIIIAKADVFEHTISKRHKYNKLFVGIAQGNYPNEDLDFIVLNRDKLQCRYCDFVTINSAKEDINGHIENSRHQVRKQGYLNTNNTLNTRESTIDRKSLKALDSLITLKQKIKFNTAQFSDSCGATELTNDNELPKCIVVTEDSMYRCTVCKKKIPYTSFNMKQHINGKSHKEMLKTSISTDTSANQERKIVTPQELPKPVVIRQNPTYTCATCRTEVINTAFDIEMHNCSRIHLNNDHANRVSLQRSNYQRANLSYETQTIRPERSTVSDQRWGMEYSRPTTSYHSPINNNHHRRKEESQCNIL